MIGAIECLSNLPNQVVHSTTYFTMEFTYPLIGGIKVDNKASKINQHIT